MIELEEMTPDQRRKYGFVRLADSDLCRIGIKSNVKRNIPLEILKTCEACGMERIYHRNALLNRKNRSLIKQRAHLCRDCYYNNRAGRSIPKGWRFN